MISNLHVRLFAIPITLFFFGSYFIYSAYCSKHPSPEEDIPPLPGWKLVWHDEFDGKGLPSSKKWSYETGFVRNKEEQYYTRNRLENARQENGCLIIEGRKESFPNSAYSSKASREDWQHSRKEAAYTSAALHTLGKAEWLYGKVEVRAKLPKGLGSWPAIWMMGGNIKSTGWPVCGELDIMEFVSGTPQTIYGTTHWNKLPGTKEHSSKGFETTSASLTDSFHLYGIEWDENHISYFFDGKPYGTFELNQANQPDESNPFRKPLYLILNLALGGSWGGKVGDDFFPRQYVIDYVRVYEKADSSEKNI